MKEGDRVNVATKAGNVIGNVSHITEVTGFRGYKFNLVHVIVNNEIMVVKEWEVTPVDKKSKD